MHAFPFSDKEEELLNAPQIILVCSMSALHFNALYVYYITMIMAVFSGELNFKGN